MDITRWRIDNYNERGHPLSMIVLHATATDTVQESVDCFLKNETSCHYIVDRNGEIFSLVPEDKRAWHAGTGFEKSAWHDLDDINSRSIGIEFQSPYPFTFTKEQIDAGICLLKDILKRHPEIKPWSILAHSDIAPHRKEDPGMEFPWEQLGKNGIGLFPKTLKKAPKDLDIQATLSAIGYRPDLYGRLFCERAFSEHFIGKTNRDFSDTLYTTSLLFNQKENNDTRNRLKGSYPPNKGSTRSY